MRRRASTFPEHLEAYLGEFVEARRATDEGSRPPISVLRFVDQPIAGAATYATLGLSKMDLHQERGHVRQELLISINAEAESFQAARVLPAIAAELLSSGYALLRGQVLRTAGPILAGASVEAFLCWEPVYFADALGEYVEDGDAVRIVVIWLAPITADEAEFAKAHGWLALADLLEATDPDLLDWRRPTLVHRNESGEACPHCGQRHVDYRLTDGRTLPLDERNRTAGCPGSTA